ncbi:MAG: 2-aminoethylphosphonate--pyruvate transaminase [Planctomycetes bacterium]|nr:2-aminoethylphosphonate--pyruvate transaminase [Planctomycetota bacterium]
MILQQDKLLFTPGPLTTSAAVKEAMLRDVGSRDAEFVNIVREIRQQLLGVAGVSQADGYEGILIQGSGTFAIEAVISSVIPRDGKLLIIINGAYGKRIRDIAKRHGIETVVIEGTENAPLDPQQVRQSLTDDSDITHVAMVHCETSSGILNPVHEIGAVVKELRRTFFVDAMSSFGGIPLNVAEAGIDFLVSSANKCIEGVPGFSLVIADRAKLLASDGAARTVSLDLVGQWKGLEDSGQFRFTPPTQVLLAFRQALRELDDEGGAAGRSNRYAANHATLLSGMRRMGFREYVPAELQSHIITSFLFPEDPNFEFKKFYQRLSDKGMVIYPGKLTEVDCFRIGNIGRLFESDIELLLTTIESTLLEMNVEMPDQESSRPTKTSHTVEYEDYDSTSGNYDNTRVPIGVPIILDYLASTPTALSEQTVLDAGCGTGSCLSELRGHVGSLYGRELNAGMQQVAKERFADDPAVQIEQGSITELPFADETFDGIVCNQVLHHLDPGESDGADSEGFPNVRSFFREAFRVLRPHGVLVINTSSHQQHRDGFWWAALIPAAIDRMVPRFPSIDRFKNIFKQTGFIGFATAVPLEEVLQGKQYLDSAGPLSAAWRAGDSSWSLATEEELALATTNVTSMLDDGSMDAFMEERELLRAKIGQTTFLVARKP